MEIVLQDGAENRLIGQVGSHPRTRDASNAGNGVEASVSDQRYVHHKELITD